MPNPSSQQQIDPSFLVCLFHITNELLLCQCYSYCKLKYIFGLPFLQLCSCPSSPSHSLRKRQVDFLCFLGSSNIERKLNFFPLVTKIDTLETSDESQFHFFGKNDTPVLNQLLESDCSTVGLRGS